MRPAQRFQIQKPRAGVYKRLGCFVGTKAINLHPFGPQVHDQRGEVAVGRDDAKGIGPLGIQQLHRIHRHGHVGSVFALGVIELLHRPQRVIEQLALPAAQVRLGPVAVNAADADLAQGGQLCQDVVHLLGGRIVGINEQGNARLRRVVHVRPPAASTPAPRPLPRVLVQRLRQRQSFRAGSRFA